MRKPPREKIGDGKALLALSGGVDSSVACKLLANAIGGRLTCIFVDHGLMRKNEGDEVEAAFADSGVNFVRVNAGERFLKKLKGVSEPEKKRKIIGEEFIRVFEEEAKKIGRLPRAGHYLSRRNRKRSRRRGCNQISSQRGRTALLCGL